MLSQSKKGKNENGAECNAKTTDSRKLCIVLLVLCVIFTITSIVGCKGSSGSPDNKYTSKVEGTKAKAKTEKKEKKKDKVQDVDALEFVTLYNENKLSYSKKYNGKKVRITSTIYDISANPFNNIQWTMSLDSGYPDQLTGTIDCVLSSDGKAKAGSYKNGDTITIVGVVDGSSPFNATLKSCDIDE